MKYIVHKAWEETRLEASDGDLTWELFHENSKTNAFDSHISHEDLRRRMMEIVVSDPYNEFPNYPLPAELPVLNQEIGQLILNRKTARNLEAVRLDFPTLAALLHYSYGETRDNKDNDFPHPFRVIPSGGALFPLEVFFHTTLVEGLPSGLFHYSPGRNSIQLIREGDETREISECLVQPELAYGASIVFFISAVFERSIFKYGDRGYRFALLEAGHLSQNLNLVATALGLGTTNVGGYFDRKVDRMLTFDGISQSTIYMCSVGADKPDEDG